MRKAYRNLSLIPRLRITIARGNFSVTCPRCQREIAEGESYIVHSTDAEVSRQVSTGGSGQGIFGEGDVMSAVIAREPGGFCTCGLRVEPGERVFPRPDGAIHVGCPERARAAGPTVPQAESSGFLFNDMQLQTIETARQTVRATRISFDGPSAMQIDTPRLSAQLSKVFNLMRDSRYRTLSEIAAVAGCLETSASARLRDFRKARFGGHTVISRQREDSQTYEYRLILREKAGSGRRNAA